MVAPGQQAIEYFSGLPLASEASMPEALKLGNNEAEWIVDLTTQAERQGRCQPHACTLPGFAPDPPLQPVWGMYWRRFRG